jgi:hypothetical protein
MIRNPIPIERGLRIQLPSGNVVEVTSEDGALVSCAYRHYVLDDPHKLSRCGVQLTRLFLEKRGVFL